MKKGWTRSNLALVALVLIFNTGLYYLPALVSDDRPPFAYTFFISILPALFMLGATWSLDRLSPTLLVCVVLTIGSGFKFYGLFVSDRVPDGVWYMAMQWAVTYVLALFVVGAAVIRAVRAEKWSR